MAIQLDPIALWAGAPEWQDFIAWRGAPNGDAPPILRANTSYVLRRPLVATASRSMAALPSTASPSLAFIASLMSLSE